MSFNDDLTPERLLMILLQAMNASAIVQSSIRLTGQPNRIQARIFRHITSDLSSGVNERQALEKKVILGLKAFTAYLKRSFPTSVVLCLATHV